MPKLVNRGPAGLLSKLKHPPAPSEGKGGKPIPASERNKIAPELLKVTIVPIDSLVPDPMNARLHPERNLEAIKQSLTLYGQVKPLVVRKDSKTVVAGNGTLEAAKALGWDKIAVTMIGMDETQAAGFGLADNRTAELAKWDFEVVAKLDQLMREAGRSDMVGWSLDELEVLRAADWTPPSLDSDASFGGNSDEAPLLLSLSPDERGAVDQALAKLHKLRPDTVDLSEGAGVSLICKLWVKGKG